MNELREKKYSGVILMTPSTNLLKRNKIIASIIPSIFLILAIIDGLPYGFYSLLRLIVFFTIGYLAWLAIKSKNLFWAWLYGLVIILFNPIIPIYLSRDIWVIVDVFTAFIVIISLFIFKLPKKFEV